MYIQFLSWHIKSKEPMHDMTNYLTLYSAMLNSTEHMGESSKFPKSLTFKTPNLKTCSMPTIRNFKFKWPNVFRQTYNKSEKLL